jgi:hypothetical protein
MISVVLAMALAFNAPDQTKLHFSSDFLARRKRCHKSLICHHPIRANEAVNFQKHLPM